jgi:hypothetical protein
MQTGHLEDAPMPGELSFHYHYRSLGPHVPCQDRQPRRSFSLVVDQAELVGLLDEVSQG